MITLEQSLLLGEGAHKACYVHPDNPDLCIKVPFKLPDVDIEREMSYRAILDKRKLHKSMITNYYGCVDTNKGPGYVFELVRDYDGMVSTSLLKLFTTPGLLESHLGCNGAEFMKKFHDIWMDECVVTSDTDFVNFYVQKLSPDTFSIRIIDNIGTPVILPLAFYFDYFAKKRAERYWKRIENTYTSLCKR